MTNIESLLRNVSAEKVRLSESEMDAIIARVTIPKPNAVKRIANEISVCPVQLWMWMAKQSQQDDPDVLVEGVLVNPLKSMIRAACGSHSEAWFCERYKISQRSLSDAIGRAPIPSRELIRLANALGIPPASLWRWLAKIPFQKSFNEVLTPKREHA